MNKDSTCGEIDLPHARVDERQREARVELEDVVRRAGRDLGDAAQLLAALLLDLEADELERVVLALGRLGQLFALDLDRGAARNLAVEADHRPAAGSLRLDDLRGLDRQRGA